MSNVAKIKIDEDEFKTYNLNKDFDNNLDNCDNENNIKKIQQLRLESTNENKSGKGSSSDSLERDSKNEEFDAEFENADQEAQNAVQKSEHV